jgi:hypothetical protein
MKALARDFSIRHPGEGRGPEKFSWIPASAGMTNPRIPRRGLSGKSRNPENIPAQAGIESVWIPAFAGKFWIPVYTGMTSRTVPPETSFQKILYGCGKPVGEAGNSLGI